MSYNQFASVAHMQKSIDRIRATRATSVSMRRANFHPFRTTSTIVHRMMHGVANRFHPHSSQEFYIKSAARQSWAVSSSRRVARFPAQAHGEGPRSYTPRILLLSCCCRLLCARFQRTMLGSSLNWRTRRTHWKASPEVQLHSERKKAAATREESEA